MTIKHGEEPRRAPAGAQFRRVLDAGTTASVSVILPCSTGETRPGTCPRAQRPAPGYGFCRCASWA